jgi:hypothetical protein
VDELLRELNRLNELNEARNNYAKTLALLRALKTGTVTLDNVTMSEDGWNVAAVAEPPVEPPKIAETEGPNPDVQ